MLDWLEHINHDNLGWALDEDGQPHIETLDLIQRAGNRLYYVRVNAHDGVDDDATARQVQERGKAILAGLKARRYEGTLALYSSTIESLSRYRELFEPLLTGV